MTPRVWGASPGEGGISWIKQPNVSGQFYPADASELSRQIDAFFESADRKPHEQKIQMLIAPHAGYLYSGAVAAHSFRAAGQGRYATIIVMAPSHYFDFEGISVWEKGGFQTPLGKIDVDEGFAQALIKSDPQFGFNPQVFSQEHSLEVELPFLQKTFKDFKIVPILMGRPDYKVCQSLAHSLSQFIGTREDVLIVISTDLSHYHEARVAKMMDHQALSLIKDLNPEELWNSSRRGETELCGLTPVVTGLLYALERHLKGVEVLKYAHSGNVTGDNSRVVGYSAVVFTQDGSTQDPAGPAVSSLTLSQKKRLIQIAKETVKNYIETGRVTPLQETDPRLGKGEGAFVTLRKNGQLRGCIGRIFSNGPLYLTVQDMAISAATKDPRFSAVTQDELKAIDVEVSILSKPEVIRDVAQIQMGHHGVIISHEDGGNHRAQGVFLPQVATETGWTKEEFLSQLCSQKAELPQDCWRDPGTTIEIFTAEVFSEKDLAE